MIYDNEEDTVYFRNLNEAITEIFEYFDSDRSGTIDVSELTKATRALGMDLNEAEIKDLMGKVDVDKSGHVSAMNFSQILFFGC